VQCQLRCVKFRRVSDPRRAFLPAFAVTGNSDDWYKSTMGIIVIGLETHPRAGENFGNTWEHRGYFWMHLKVLVTSLGMPQITVLQFGKNYIFFGNAAGEPGNHSYYLSFSDFKNSCIQFVFPSLYLYIYITPHLHTIYLDCGC
jgi:hypothetical protein